MKNELPKSPEEMPIAFHNGEDNSLRNCLMSLDSFLSVDIHWEMDVRMSNASGESHGDWTVEIQTNRRAFKCKHESLTNALWFAYELASADDTDEYDQREKARAAALAKLSPDERKALGLAR